MNFETYQQGSLRYITPDGRGLMWSVADVVRAVGLGIEQGRQIVAYAPNLAEREPHPELPHLTLVFMPHEVVQHWLRNRVSGHALWNHLNRFNAIRKFPTIPAPAALPLAKNKRVRDVAANPEADGIPRPAYDAQLRADRCHTTTWIADRCVGVLYVDELPWVLWADVCQYILPKTGLTPNLALKSIQARFPEKWASAIRRVRARNKHDVVVISPSFFTALMNVWCFEAYAALILTEHGGLTLPELWESHARAHRTDRKGTAKETRAGLKQHDWKPGEKDSAAALDRKRSEAERIAVREMGSYSEMLKNIKPE
jgi:hypothetical protein